MENENIWVKLSVEEAARMTAWFEAMGLTGDDAVDCLNYISTGRNLPKKKN